MTDNKPITAEALKDYAAQITKAEPIASAAELKSACEGVMKAK